MKLLYGIIMYVIMHNNMYYYNNDAMSHSIYEII